MTSITMYKSETTKGTIYYTTKEGLTVAKKCTKCKYVKSLTKFDAHKDGVGRRSYECSDCLRERGRQYRQTSHGRVVVFLHHAKSDVKEAEEKFGIAVEDNLKKYDIAMIQATDECSYCGKFLEPHEVTIDHVQPFRQGGSNDYRNLLPSCSTCNTRKGDKPLYEFLTKHVDEYYRKRVIFTLASRYGISYDQMEEQLKLDRTYNLYVQNWETIQREGLTYLFESQEDFEAKKAEFKGGTTHEKINE